jgi:protein-S-isoprenylcysteine O-methyltransferase Ste14
MSDPLVAQQSVDKKGAIDRSHDTSLLPKAGFFVLHLGSIVLCLYMVWGAGIETVGGWLGQTWTVTDPVRGQLLVAVASLYWVRHSVALFYLLVRKVEWGEVFGLSLFMVSFEVAFCVLAAGALRDQAIVFGLPENKGHCYTEGLFAWSMHINYFGDTVLFTGWCLLTANWWTLALPILMAASFIFFHIPGLDTYLADRYGDEFVEYASKTKKFMPFVY